MTTNPDISEKRKFLLKLTRWILIGLGVVLVCAILGTVSLGLILTASAAKKPSYYVFIIDLAVLAAFLLPISCFVAAYFVKEKQSLKPLIKPLILPFLILSLVLSVFFIYLIVYNTLLIPN